MADLREGEEILVEVPGVLTSNVEGSEALAFSEVTQFRELITAHARSGKDIFRADEVTPDPKTGRVTFTSRDTIYNAREFREDDGEWLSRYSLPLPHEALAGLTTQGNGTDMDTPETITGYTDGGFLTALLYENNGGRWIRHNSQWVPLAPSDTSLNSEDATFFEVNPETAQELVELFDSKHVSDTEAQAFSTEGA